MLLFDTGKRLEKAVGEEAAQIIIEAFEKLSEEQKKEVATKGNGASVKDDVAAVKADVAAVKADVVSIKADLRETELRVETKLKELELRLLKWQMGIGMAIILVMAKGFGWLGF